MPAHSRLIVFLLGAILAVLLFGREAVLGSVQTFAWIAVGGFIVLAAGLIAWLFGKALFFEVPKELYSDLRELRRAGKPWIIEAVLFVGLPFGMIWIAGALAKKYAGVDLTSYSAIAGFVWAVVCSLFFAGFMLRGLRGLIRNGVPSLRRRESAPIGFSIEYLDDATIEVRHHETGTTFSFRLIDGKPVGPHQVWRARSWEPRSGARIDMDDTDVVKDLTAVAHKAAVALLKVPAKKVNATG